MKKLLLITIAFLGIIFTANAVQGICNISNDTGSSVYVTVLDWDKEGNIRVKIGNDSYLPVNVSFTFTWEYYMEGKWYSGNYPKTTSQVFSETQGPGSDIYYYTVKRPHGTDQKMWRVLSVDVYGARCLKK